MSPTARARSRIGTYLTLVAGLVAVAAIGAGPATANTPPGTTDVDEAGAYQIFTLTDVLPGSTRSGYWNNTPQGYAHFVDAWPVPTAILQNCKIEVVRWWKETTQYLDGTEMRLHWSVKNVGSETCDADVYLAWIRPAGS